MDRPNTITTLVNLATRTPMLIAFIPENDNNAIYIGHSHEDEMMRRISMMSPEDRKLFINKAKDI